jgi:hypothetical protein
VAKRVEELKKHLRPGRVYRREDLAHWSNAVDRHIKALVDDGALTKLAGGLYMHPKQTVFGEAPAEEAELVSRFLKDHRFLLASPNSYNALGVGTTQLYDKTVVYNHKRHGPFTLGGRNFDFRVKHSFPRKLTREFLLVDLVNNLDRLAENQEDVLARVKERAANLDERRLQRAVRDFGNMKTRKFFSQTLRHNEAQHAG